MLFFGFIRDYKGLDLLIDAFGDPRLQDMGVKLIVAGEFYGSPEPYLERIRSLDISDIVILHNDYIPDSRVNLYFCAADIVAQPYKNATQSGVTQVAFHFEVPMLVTNVGRDCARRKDRLCSPPGGASHHRCTDRLLQWTAGGGLHPGAARGEKEVYMEPHDHRRAAGSREVQKLGVEY